MRRERTLPATLLGLATFFLVFSLAFFLWTGSTAGPRLQGRLAAIAIEIDRWLPAHRDDIEASARERPRVAIQVTDLPLDASVPASVVLDDQGSGLRAALVASMGETLYQRGRAAFHGGGSIALTEPSRWLMDIVRPSVHHAWAFVVLLNIALLILLGTLNAISTTATPLSAILRPVAFGSGAALLTSIALWIAWRGGTLLVGPTITGESLLVLRDYAAISIRIGFGLCLGAGAILLLLNITLPDAARHAASPRRPGLPG